MVSVGEILIRPKKWVVEEVIGIQFSLVKVFFNHDGFNHRICLLCFKVRLISPKHRDLQFLAAERQQSLIGKHSPQGFWGFTLPNRWRLTIKKTAFDIPNHQPPASKSPVDGFFGHLSLETLPKKRTCPMLIGYFQLTLRPSFWPPKPPVFFRRKIRVTGWPWASHGTLCLWSEFHARMAASDGGRKLRSTDEKRVSWVGDLKNFRDFEIWYIYIIYIYI